MANVKLPLRFQIYRGDTLVREETVSEPVIKVGKLASSHLRLDDESVSRMHAVIEVNGAEDIQVIDLGSTHGTLVNGEKITRHNVRAGDEIAFGTMRVVMTFADEEATKVAVPQVVDRMIEQSSAAPSLSSTPTAPVPPAPALRAPTPAPRSPSQVPPVGMAPAAPSFPSAPVAPPMSFAPPPAAPSVGGGYGGAGFGAAAAIASEAEEPGSQAVEVQALYRGVVTVTRHLSDPTEKSTGGQGKAIAIVGAALVGASLMSLIYMRSVIGSEKQQHEEYLAAGKEPSKFVWQHHGPAGDVIFLGGGILGIVLAYMGLKRVTTLSKNFVVGSGADVDAPLASEFAPSGSHALVAAAGADYAVNVAPQMTGEVVTGGQTIPLQQYVQQRGSSFPVPQDGRIRIDAGASQFYVTSTAKPRVLPVPFLLWNWAEQKYTAGSVIALMLFLLMIFAVPPDPKSLSLDLLNSDNRLVNFLIKPPEEKEEIPEWLKKKNNDDQGGKGKRHKGDEGKMGKKESKNKQGLYGLKGPKDNPDPHLAKKLAEEQAKNAGILGLIKNQEGSHLASIFGRDTALGSDAENVLGGLLGNEIGEAYGVGGLGLVGTGSGGGGTGEGTIGLGNLGTIGKGGGGGNGSGYGRGAGGLGGRRARAPDVIPGQAAVRGSLDKEIIRRIIRRHINEVKFCYEQELTKKPELQGRIAVQFTIAATGQVVTSVMQNSTVGNPRVENCVVQAVRRWEFPKPRGGGIVIVSYPFVFNPAGGGEQQ